MPLRHIAVSKLSIHIFVQGKKSFLHETKNYYMAKLTQEELLAIFDAVKKEVAAYEKGTIKARMDAEGKYDLWNEKPVEAFGRKYPAMFFASAMVKSDYVGFYFMPVYSNEEIKDVFHPDLLKCLKGKSCFHIKTTDKELMKHIKTALKAGYAQYKKNGWV
ncbi:hypothetical protein CAP35_04285 [Chitinophagaceae bacterium IBVUCB1]|nr:hypothetical protein CAP35_04285 [Chitinophagaceae bacterium IBVUCB1]